MIYCPKCGTANRDGSRFCNECGEELGAQTHVKCPRCGALNPVQNVLCVQCSGRLLPFAPSPPDAGATPPIKGLSLPTKSPTGEQGQEADAAAAPEPGDEVPAWLRELGASLSAGDRADDSDSPEDVAEVPDWLRDLRASLPQESEGEVEAEEEKTLPDWLAPSRPGFEPQPPEPEAPAAEGEPEDEVPGWLARLVPSAAATAAPETEPPGPKKDETPGWLFRLVPGEAEAETEQPEEGEGAGWPYELVPEAPAESKEGDIPDWLADLRAADEEAEAGTEPSDSEVKEGEITAWLASLRAAGKEAEAGMEPPGPENEEGKAPAWLADLRAAGEEAEAGTEPSDAGGEEGEIPYWLAGLRAADEEAEAGTEPSDSEIEEGEIPDWMAALRPADWQAGSRPEPAAIDSGETQFPDRITELEPPSAELPRAEPLDEAEMKPLGEKPALKLPDEVEAALGPAVPTWLAELQIEAPETAAAILEEAAASGELPEWLVRSETEPGEGLAPAEIPNWLLALKPTALRTGGEGVELPAPSTREWSEETGLLAGIPGTLPVEMLIAQPRAVAAAESLDVTIEDSPPARLFSEIVSLPPDAAPKEIASPRADVLPKAARWIIYALLIIAVTLPIIIGKPLLSRTIEPTAATVEMHRAIESLGSLAPVLVAFDYDPTSSGEMDVIARALIGHLMDREARLVVVSLLPAGPATAQSLLDELAASRPAYTAYGERYANLGYLPGQAAAVRLLGLSMETALPRDLYGTPLSDLPVMQGLDSTRSFSLIVELAAAQDTLRWWIEQAGAPLDVPLGTGASAAVIPIARPYYETEARQLVGLVGGVADAATYEALAGGQSTPTSSSAALLDSQLAGQLLFVLVILAGNVVYLARRGTRRER